MKTVTLTEFRSRASGLLREVENGETLIVTRRGRRIAEVLPVNEGGNRQPSWKGRALRLCAKGASLAAAIREERAHNESDLLTSTTEDGVRRHGAAQVILKQGETGK